MTTVVFDMSDPGVKQTVDGWADATEYEVTMRIKTGTGPTRNVAEVVSMETEDAETEDAAAAPVEEETPAVEEEAVSKEKMPAIKYGKK